MQLTLKETRKMCSITSKIHGVDIEKIEAYWTFKVIERTNNILKEKCKYLAQSEGFLIHSPKWNRDPDYEVEGWVCTLGFVGTLTSEEFLKLLHKVLIHFSDENFGVIELGTKLLPKRLPNQSVWEARWDNCIHKEMAKLSKIQPNQILKEISDFKFCEIDEIKLSPWLAFCQFKLQSNSIYLTDMCLGPTENGISIDLPPGNYLAEIQKKKSEFGIVNINLRLVLDNSIITSQAQIGNVMTDQGYIGFFDEQRLKSCFHYDTQSLFEWGEYEFQANAKRIENANLSKPTPSNNNDYGVLVYDLARHYVLPYLSSSYGDGTHKVSVLLQKSERVGFLVEFQK